MAVLKQPWWQPLQNALQPATKRSTGLRALAQWLIERGGESRHSAAGATLGYFISQLEDARCPYVLSALPGYGYVIQVLSPEKRKELLDAFR